MTDCFEFANSVANTAKLRALIPAGERIPDNDTLAFYLDCAEEIVLNTAFPFGNATREMRMRALKRYSNTMLRIAYALIAKQGAEGETQHTENGISRRYDSSDVPAALLKQITPYGKAYTVSTY